MSELRITALITTYNRAQTTIRGIDSLIRGMAQLTDVTLNVIVVDDMSPDRTGTQLRKRFPQVHVKQGTGSLYWCGGTQSAFLESLASGGSCDAYLLFNDDTILHQSVMSEFLKEFLRLTEDGTPIALVGATQSSVDRSITYGGYLQTSRWRPLALKRCPIEGGQPVRCDTFNGNFVLLSATLLQCLNGVDAKLIHTLGDIDLGLRALRNGGHVYQFSRAVGLCDHGPDLGSRLKSLPFRKRYELLKRQSGFNPYLRFVWRHGPRGLFPAYVVKGFASRVRLLVAPDQVQHEWS